MPETSHAQAAARPELDDLMLAMDVVDTLRHQENLVARELDESRREAELIERLRQIYRGQGIEVPDRVLAEGVSALKESRFVYTPPPPGLATSLARLWVNRGRFYRLALALAGAVAVAWAAHQFFVVRPEQQRAEQARIAEEQRAIDLNERLPRILAQRHEEALSEAKADAARERADRLLADGRAALARGDAAAARQAIAGLEGLLRDLRLEYVLRIVSRPGEPSGVWRIPDRNRNARNYYLIVEAVAPDGKLVALPVTSEENGRTANVAKWGVRVSADVFEAVRRDKNDDGIVQRARLGEKRRGFLDVEYATPVLGGAITEW